MGLIAPINTEHKSRPSRIDADHPADIYRPFGSINLQASPRSCEQLQKLATKRQIRTGETLFWEDDNVEYAYFLTEGTMKAYKLLPNGRSQIIRFVVAGELIASTCTTTHSCTAQALADCTILKLPRKHFEEILLADPVLMSSLRAKRSSELRQMQKQILLLGRMPAVERVSHFLLDIAERQNPGNAEFEPGFLVRLPMARADIADYLGLTIETVSRAFSKFRREGLIDLPRPNLVRLRDQTGLQQQSLA